jgi:hypothetical protein
MTPREKQIEEELRRLDPHLAGLFKQGLEYTGRAHEPGGIYMLSHAARELSAAMIRLLSNEGDPPISEDDDRVPSDEGHRVKIAMALGLGVMHPSVTTWMRTHKALQETAHYRSKAPSAEAVQRTIDAVRVLTDILFGRIGLYFDARQDLDILLAKENPTPEDVERLRALVLRPQLRRAFFHQLPHAGWLEPLRQTNLFREVPDVSIDPESGESRWTPWPEGEYLANIAPDAPEQVVEVLKEIPDAIRNPDVWRSVADATLRLPPAQAIKLVTKLTRALDQTEHPAVSRSVFAVAEFLANENEGDAITLLRALIKVDTAPNPGRLRATPTGEAAVLPRMRHTARSGAFLRLVEKIAALRPSAIVPELGNRLNSMLQIEYGDPAGRETPVPDYSRAARRTFAEEMERSAIGLMAAAVHHAAPIAATHANPGPSRVLSSLSRHPWHVFTRLRLAFLADTPVFDQEQLDAAIGDLSLLESQPVLPEYRQLIQTHFTGASDAVQQAVIQRILAGPDQDLIDRVVAWSEAGGAGEAADPAKSLRESWQRHLLRLFGETPPPALEALAGELGTHSETLSKYDRDMDERGFAMEVGAWGGPPSPLTLDEVKAMSADELIEFLRTFAMEPGRRASTPSALASVLAEWVRQDPARATPLLEKIAAEGVDPTYVRGMLEGLDSAVRARQQIPWRESLVLVAQVVSQAPDAVVEGSPAQYLDHSDPGFTWARTTAADLLRDCATNSLVPAEHLGNLWAAVEALIRADATWVSGPAVAASMDDVLFQALNHLSGKATGALLEVALYDYRLSESSGRDEEWEARDRLRCLLEMILERSTGEGAVAARSTLGRSLPQVVFLDLPWVEANWGQLFSGAVETPLQNPLFASYVAQADVYGQTFTALRPLYQAAVDETARNPNHWTIGEESFRPGRHLLDHLFTAYQGGLVEIDQDEDLLDHAFTNGNPEDTAHVWWSVFRSWTDSQDPVSEVLVRRVVRLAEWRLARLEGEEESERTRQEAEGLGWLALVDALPDETVLPLLLRAVRISGGKVPVAGDLWERLARMAVLDVRAATEIATLIIDAELDGDFPYFNRQEIAPVLRAGLAAGESDAQERATRTIHTLGDRGFEQFGDLLRPPTHSGTGELE